MVKPKYNVGDEVIVLSENPLRVKKFSIGGIFINSDGITYNDGINLGPSHVFKEEHVFKTNKEAAATAGKLVEEKVKEFRKSLIDQISGGEA